MQFSYPLDTFFMPKICLFVFMLSVCVSFVSCNDPFKEHWERSHSESVYRVFFSINGAQVEDAAYGIGIMISDLAGWSAGFSSDLGGVRFEGATPHIYLEFADTSSAFIGGKRYDYNDYDSRLVTEVSTMVGGTAYVGRATDGWYMFSRTKNSPHDDIVVFFEFNCVAESGEIIEIRDGKFEMGRKAAVVGDSLIVKSMILP